MGGNIPMWFYVRHIGRIAAMAIDRMRQALIREEEQEVQQQQQQQQPLDSNCPAASTTASSSANSAMEMSC
jgi:hypothetical protein